MLNPFLRIWRALLGLVCVAVYCGFPLQRADVESGRQVLPPVPTCPARLVRWRARDLNRTRHRFATTKLEAWSGGCGRGHPAFPTSRGLKPGLILLRTLPPRSRDAARR